MRSLSCWLHVAAVVLALPLPAQEAPTPKLVFGLYAYKRPTEVLRDFTPVLDELRPAVSKQLGHAVAIELEVYKTYDECLDKLVDGKVDLVRFGPASYVMAKQRNKDVQLLAAESEEGKAGVIAVRSDSAIKTLADLKGKAFAFGDENSTIGRFLSQALLVDAGIHAQELKKFSYLDRHDNVYNVVKIGDYDAGALHIATFNQLNKDGGLRELARFENVGKPWIGRAGLDAATVKALRAALLGLKQPETLKALKVKGFRASCDSDFDIVRAGMKAAEKFGAGETTQPAPAGKD
jgi:phosphonate transport system substrate-binding protein